MTEQNLPKPNYIWTLLTTKCPRCRRGKMFTRNSAYSSLSPDKMLEMPERCEVCGQKYELEPGFWFGTGYVSYALSVALIVTGFVAWWVLIGFSVNDTRIFWWMGLQVLFLILIQPWLMRISRTLYIRFFVSYDDTKVGEGMD